jgi:hypothetical protein
MRLASTGVRVRGVRRRALRGAAALAAALVVSGPLWSAPASEATSPRRAVGDVVLRDVVAIAADDAWAVGDGGIATHWDGAHWASQHLGGLHSPDLNGIAAASSEDVWTVGGVIVQDAFRGFATHWDGTHWRREVIPGYPGEAILQDVAIRSTSEAYAVGRWFAVTPGGRRGGGVIVHWDGGAWRRVPVPTSVRTLVAVTTLSGGRFMAVGASATGPVAVPIGLALPLSVKALPGPVGSRCAAHDLDGPPAIVVGTCRPVSQVVPMRPYVVDRQNGRWQLRTVPGHNSELWGVDSDTTTWAVGRRGAALILRRRPDGTWFRVDAPSPPNNSALFAVDARTFGDAWAVGLSGMAVHRPLALRWDGASWSAIHVPLP